ncbi:MAG: hypothetical protein JSV91_15765 [Phycisphaerales bacterium]|nr:MAG: hypothetical protein JSV91_15765 [Phycisphaerales bacterium]
MNVNETGGSGEPILDEVGTPEGATMPLGVGELGEEVGVDVLASTGNYRKLRAGSLVLGIVVVCAVAGLFSMRFLATTTAALTGNAEFEKIIEDFFGGGNGGKTAQREDGTSADDSILEVLNETYTEHQVPLANVIKNPFIVFQSEVIPLPEVDDGGNDLDSERQRAWMQQREARRASFEQAASRLFVKSILMGSSPLANINNRIVHIGDVVPAGSAGVEFRVIAMTADTVTVAATAPEYDLIVEHTLRMREGS